MVYPTLDNMIKKILRLCLDALPSLPMNRERWAICRTYSFYVFAASVMFLTGLFVFENEVKDSVKPRDSSDRSIWSDQIRRSSAQKTYDKMITCSLLVILSSWALSRHSEKKSQRHDPEQNLIFNEEPPHQ